VAPELGIEGLLLLVYRLMAVFPAPFGYCRQAPSKTLLHRSHIHHELPSPAARANVREAEEIERGRFLPLLLRMFLCIPPKVHQPCLLRVERQTESCKSLRQDLHHLFSILPILEAQHGIIGETYLVGFPRQAGLHFLLEPFIEQVGRDEACWR
jgi:hypothetical protein